MGRLKMGTKPAASLTGPMRRSLRRSTESGAAAAAAVTDQKADAKANHGLKRKAVAPIPTDDASVAAAAANAGGGGGGGGEGPTSVPVLTRPAKVPIRWFGTAKIKEGVQRLFAGWKLRIVPGMKADIFETESPRLDWLMNLPYASDDEKAAFIRERKPLMRPVDPETAELLYDFLYRVRMQDLFLKMSGLGGNPDKFAVDPFGHLETHIQEGIDQYKILFGVKPDPNAMTVVTRTDEVHDEEVAYRREALEAKEFAYAKQRWDALPSEFRVPAAANNATDCAIAAAAADLSSYIRSNAASAAANKVIAEMAADLSNAMAQRRLHEGLDSTPAATAAVAAAVAALRTHQELDSNPRSLPPSGGGASASAAAAAPE